ncbi:MAG: ABC transporter permease [Treponema sp.]|jgi:peptide/nickel transport system permease protein|nr:ABC transporter permease [Treponema sp.]
MGIGGLFARKRKGGGPDMNRPAETRGWHSLKYIALYLLRGISLLFAAGVVSFALVSVSPIDPIQQYILANPGVSEENITRMEEYWGLNEPPVSRYFSWMGAILRGDLGMSKSFRRPVAEIIGHRFGASLALMAAAWTLTGLFGFGIGCVMGMFHGRLADRVIKRICLVMCSVPTFWIGLVFLMVFSAWLGWFPFGMAVPPGVPAAEVTLLQRLRHLVLPALTLSFLSFANLALHTREKLVDVLESDYVLFAKARGEKPGSILRRHGLRNILIPAVTMQFGSFSELFGGSVIAENIFSYPGLGAAATSSAMTDIPLFLGITLFSTLFVFVGNMTANILYGIIDPKIREGYR